MPTSREPVAFLRDCAVAGYPGSFDHTRLKTHGPPLYRRSMDNEFELDPVGLTRAMALMQEVPTSSASPLDAAFWPSLPEGGVGARQTIEWLAPYVLGGAARLDSPNAFAHMDPPTPWLTWAMALWNASLNQNQLHPATAPFAREAERLVIAWLAPLFGMNGGHMTSGSTLANLTALWAARELAGVRTVIAGTGAHNSVPKAAHLLGLDYCQAPSNPDGTIAADDWTIELSKCALVLTAGTTSTGGIDPLSLADRAAWTHVDSAWAGPLRFTDAHATLLDGIERADSVAVSAHKWLFQPKPSGIVLFRDVQRANRAISFSADYLASPTIGVGGSRGADAIPLLATLIAWGRAGMARRIEACMATARLFAEFVLGQERLELFAVPQSGVVVWRLRDERLRSEFARRLPTGLASQTVLGGETWLRCVSANPKADLAMLIAAVEEALDRCGG